jgi:hypothetical protein
VLATLEQFVSRSDLCRSYMQTYIITSSDKDFYPYLGPAYFSNFAPTISTGNAILGHPVFTSYRTHLHPQLKMCIV